MCSAVFWKYPGLTVTNDKTELFATGRQRLEQTEFTDTVRSTIKLLGACFHYHNPSRVKDNFDSIFKTSKCVEVQRSNLTRKNSNWKNFRYSKILLDLPQVDLMNFRVEYVRPRSGRFFFVAKRPSERRSRERSTCLA